MGMAWWKDEEDCFQLREVIANHGLESITAARVVWNGSVDSDFVGYLETKIAFHLDLGLFLSAYEMETDLYEGLVVIGPDDPSTLSMLVHRAVALSNSGESQQARQLIESASGMQHELHPNDPYLRVRIGGVQGEILSRLNDHASAIEVILGSIQDASEVLGDDHPVTLGLGLRLAAAFIRSDDIASAAEIFPKLERGYQDFPSQHSESVRARYLIEQVFPGGRDALLRFESRSDDERLADRRRASAYRHSMQEDWNLLYGTAGRVVRVKRSLREGAYSQIVMGMLSQKRRRLPF